MKFIRALLILVFAAGVFAQEITEKGKFGITVGDRIELIEFFDRGKKLLLVGKANALVWDVEANKLDSSVMFDRKPDFGMTALRPQLDKVFSAARLVDAKPLTYSEGAIFDVATGKKLHVFDRSATGGFWSRNGKTFVSTNEGELKQFYSNYGVNKEISIWDGETFALRKTLAFDNLYNILLTDDGARLYVYSKDKAKTARLEVYNAVTGALENTLLAENKQFEIKASPDFSASGALLGQIVENKAAKNRRSLMVWRTDGTEKPAYEITPAAGISGARVIFSRDERLVAIDTGKIIEIFELASARKIGEVANSSLPFDWIADNSIFLYYRMGLSISTGLAAYPLDPIHETVEESDSSGNKSQRVVDESLTIPAPNDKYLLFYSNNQMRVYEARSGKLLWTKQESGGFPRKADSLIVKILNIKDTSYKIYKSAWAAGGELFYSIDSARGTVTVWSVR